MGGKPTAKNGVEPYLYKWTSVIYDRNHKIIDFKNKIINNDTIANPIYSGNYVLPDLFVKFYVNVTDKDQNSGIDSIMITKSSIALTTAILNIPTINKGDTCQLIPVNIVFGFPPLKYAWKPVYNLSNQNVENPFAWPDTSTTYNVEVTDSLGCIGHDEVDVSVNTVDIKQFNSNSNYILTSNPVRDNTIITFNFNIANEKLSIYKTDGKAIFTKKIISNTVEIGKIIRMPGLYFFILEKDNRIISRGKFLKE